MRVGPHLAIAAALLALAGAACGNREEKPRASEEPPAVAPIRPAPRPQPTRPVEAAPPRVRGRVELRVEVQEGARSAAELEAAYAGAAPLLRSCYERALRGDPRLAGSITLAVQLTDRGGVDAAEVREDTVKHEDLVTCVSTRLRGTRLPAGAGGRYSVHTTFVPEAQE